MNYEEIDDLSIEQILEMYENIIDFPIEIIGCTTNQTWYVKCSDNTTRIIRSKTHWDCSSKYLCSTGRMVTSGCNEITIDACNSATSGSCCLNN